MWYGLLVELVDWLAWPPIAIYCEMFENVRWCVRSVRAGDVILNMARCFYTFAISLCTVRRTYCANNDHMRYINLNQKVLNLGVWAICWRVCVCVCVRWQVELLPNDGISHKILCARAHAYACVHLKCATNDSPEHTNRWPGTNDWFNIQSCVGILSLSLHHRAHRTMCGVWSMIGVSHMASATASNETSKSRCLSMPT